MSDENIGRRLPSRHGWYKVLGRVDNPKGCYRVELSSGAADGERYYRDARWVTRDRRKFDKEVEG